VLHSQLIWMPDGPRLWQEKDLCFVNCFAALSVMRVYNADHGDCFWSLDSTLTHVGSDEIIGGMNKWQIFTATTRRDSWQRRWLWYAPVRRSCCCEWLRSQHKKVWSNNSARVVTQSWFSLEVFVLLRRRCGRKLEHRLTQHACVRSFLFEAPS